jgi:hypothetical protein
LPTSTTDRPVTHTAEVDENSAVIGSLQVPLVLDMGSISKNAPVNMTAKKPKQIVLAGLTLMLRKFQALYYRGFQMSAYSFENHKKQTVGTGFARTNSLFLWLTILATVILN